MQRLTNGTWVVVADGEKALFLQNEGDGQYPVLRLRRQERSGTAGERQPGSDRTGQPGTARGPGSAIDETGYHRLEKGRFAQDLADQLYKLSHAGKIDRLILVAAPQTLGALRPALHKEVLAKVVAEIPKALTALPVDRIERAILAELAAG